MVKESTFVPDRIYRPGEDEKVKGISPNRMYRPKEIAELLNFDISAIYACVNDINKPLPAVRLRKRLRVWGQDLIDYLENNKVEPEWE